MEVIALPKFEREYKKHTKKYQDRIKKEIKSILENPETGKLKKGDLSGIRVHKFKQEQLYLLAYEMDYQSEKLYLYSIGRHEGFYKRFKKYLRK